MNRSAGHYEETSVAGEAVEAFVPKMLPPKPPLKIDDSMASLLNTATIELAQLNTAAQLVPDKDWFIYGFVRKEAILTSQIEGYQPTLDDLFSFEATKKEPAPDLREACNYLDALEYARAELRKPNGLPLSLRLLKQSHKRLMQGVRGAHKQPGSFRTSQNWIGGTRPGNASFVPPPPNKLMECLDSLEKYLHEENELPKLVRIGLIHVQFETIHPFLDGNGRLGRLLIVLLLEEWGLLESPLLYLSVYFKRHRQLYYSLLSEVRVSGDWETWTSFFLEGVATVSREARILAQDLFSMVEQHRISVLDSPNSSVTGLRLLEELPKHPIITLQRAVDLLNTTKPTATKAINLLAGLGILQEMETGKRPRTFACQEYLDLLREDTEGI